MRILRKDRNCLECGRLGVHGKELCSRCHDRNRMKCPILREKRRIKALLYYRKKNNLPLDTPLTRQKGKVRYKTANGYVCTSKKGHPNASKKGRILEHIFVMSEHLGRPLRKGENVHHKNGIKDDNCIENLELWSKHQPIGQRVEDKINWAIQFLGEYGYRTEKSA